MKLKILFFTHFLFLNLIVIPMEDRANLNDLLDGLEIKFDNFIIDDASTELISGWSKDPKEPAYDLPMLNKDITIRKRWMYNPPSVTKNNHPIIGIISHGTFGSDTPAYFDESEEKDQIVRHSKRFLSAYAIKNLKDAELLSFKWTGNLNDKDRIDAAQRLHKFITYMGYDEHNEIITFSHSHGCNVINHVTRLLQPNRPISLIFHFGCPVKKGYKNDIYIPVNYKKIYNFSSRTDHIQALGSDSEGNAAVILAVGAAGKVISLIPPVAPLGWAMMVGAIGAHAMNSRDQSRIFTDIPNVLSFRTIINEQSVDHSPMINVLKYLETIVEKTERNYPNENNTTFNLYIDTNNAQNPVKIEFDKKNM